MRRSRALRWMLAAYVVGLHVAIALLAWRTDFTDRVRYMAIRNGFVMPRGTVFVGDSITRQMPWANYGIPGLTTRELAAMLPNYAGADRIVVTIGLNDLMEGIAPAFDRIAAFDKPMVWIAMHPNRVVDVTKGNQAIEALCRRPKCVFLDAGRLPLQPDGLHVADYRPIEEALRRESIAW